MEYGKAAAAAHAAMCNNSGFGYTMSGNARWGETGSGSIAGTDNGISWKVKRGDYDCSSSVITAWKAALAGTKYAHMLDGATYTGNIESVFLASGLFVKKPMSFLAEPGDLYLTPGKHVAMCQTQTPDVLSEFSINEKGGAYGGKVGDQTGKEAYVHAYYDYPWSCIIHYNGKLDKAETVKAKLIDVSEHNGKVDWSKVKAAGYHAILRLGYGDDLKNQDDAQFSRNVAECERLGIKWGAYLYSYAKTTKQAVSEAAHALRLLKGHKPSYPVYFDTEEKGTEKVAASNAKTFCASIENAGFWAGVYASESWWKANLKALGDRYTKWVAKYGTNTGAAQVKPTINRTDIWQYSSRGKVSGVSGYVDVNYCYRDLPGEIAKPTQPAKPKTPIEFRVHTQGKGWGKAVSGTTSGGVSGKPATYIAIKGAGKYRVKSERSGWLPYVTGYNVKDYNKGCAGDGSPIIAIEIPNASVRYAAHVSTGWLPDMIGNRDTGGSSDKFAGNGKRIDLFRVRWK